MASQPRSSYGEGDLCLNPTVPAHNPGADSNSSHANGPTSAVARARRRGGKNLSLPEPPQPQGFTCFACRVAKVRCDKSTPCNRCSQLALECISQGKGPGRPSKASTPRARKAGTNQPRPPRLGALPEKHRDPRLHALAGQARGPPPPSAAFPIHHRPSWPLHEPGPTPYLPSGPTSSGESHHLYRRQDHGVEEGKEG
ncbi:fungal specific transcription factor domain-containing protein, partial [Nannochloropsis gaditana]